MRNVGFNIDGKGIWMPNTIELTGRAELLNEYLPAEYKLYTKFYPSIGKGSVKKYLKKFVEDASLPLVDINVKAISMHDWWHQMTTLYPPWLIASYQQYAKDSLDFIEDLERGNLLEKDHEIIVRGNLLEKDRVIIYLYNKVAGDIDTELANFQNNLRASRYGFINHQFYDLVERLNSTFKNRVMRHFKYYNGGTLTLDQSQLLEKAVLQEMDSFLMGRQDIQKRVYSNKNKTYESETEMAEDVNKHIDYIAQILAENPDAQKKLIEGSFVKPTGNLK